MGVRSEVVVAMKMDIYNKLTAETVKWLNEDSDTQDLRSDGEGVSFRFEFIKWYADDDPEIIQLYKELDDADPDGLDYLIIDACSEYPDNIENDRGGWDDNPWEYYKSVTVSIEPPG
jgi:hypothetical protein